MTATIYQKIIWLLFITNHFLTAAGWLCGIHKVYQTVTVRSVWHWDLKICNSAMSLPLPKWVSVSPVLLRKLSFIHSSIFCHISALDIARWERMGNGFRTKWGFSTSIPPMASYETWFLISSSLIKTTLWYCSKDYRNVCLVSIVGTQ